MKKLLLLLLLPCVALADPPATSLKSVGVDANGNLLPVSVNGHVLNLPTGTTIGGVAPGGGGTWGSITGTLSGQTDLQTALNGKQSLTGTLALGNFGSITGTIAESNVASLVSDLAVKLNIADFDTYARDASVAAAEGLIDFFAEGGPDVAIHLENGLLYFEGGVTDVQIVYPAPWRTALGLGNSATKSVGTSIGTVAAGDHNHSGVYQPYDTDLTTWAGITPGTGVGTALAVNVGSAGAVVVNGGALGTPSSGTISGSFVTGGTFGAVNGSALTTLNGTNISTGTVAPARLGSGTPGSGNYLRGDGAWTAIDLSTYAPLASPTFTGTVTTPILTLSSAVGSSSITITGATQTTSQPILNAAQTWNASGVTFTGIKENITDTASASGSMLMDLQVGGTSKFSVFKDGTVSTTAAGASFRNVQVGYWSANDVTLPAAGYIDWSGNRIYSPATGVFSFNVTNTSTGATWRSIPKTPTQITADTNNYNPAGSSYYQRWSTDASRNITGMTFAAAQVDGQTHVIVNVGSNNIVLINESASSTAANRFHNSTGADITLAADQEVNCWYDSTTTRWRVSKRGF